MANSLVEEDVCFVVERQRDADDAEKATTAVGCWRQLSPAPRTAACFKVRFSVMLELVECFVCLKGG